MRRWAAILLGTFYLLVLARPVLPIALFSLNKGYIQSSLCEQRANVRNCCKGACFLRKQLLQAQEGDAAELIVAIASEEVEQFLPIWDPVADLTAVIVPVARPARNDFGCNQYALDCLSPPPWKPCLA